MLPLTLLLEENLESAPGAFPGIIPKQGIHLLFKKALSLRSAHVDPTPRTSRIGFLGRMMMGAMILRRMGAIMLRMTRAIFLRHIHLSMIPVNKTTAP